MSQWHLGHIAGTMTPHTTFNHNHQMHFSELHSDLRRLILSKLDKPSLLAVIQTSKFLRRDGEELLYSVVAFDSTSDDSERAKLFLRSIVRNPSLGPLVNDLTMPMRFVDWFYPSTNEGDQKKSPSALTRTVWKGMPNLKALDLQIIKTGGYIPGFIFEHPVFQLDRLKLDAWWPGLTEEHVLHVLQNQPELRHFALPSNPRLSSRSESGHGILAEVGGHGELVDGFKGVCGKLKVLEGGDWVVGTLLPGHKVKDLLWTFEGNSRPGFTASSIPKLSFLTPSLCNAYARLEYLSLRHNVPNIRQMARHLTSLIGLVLHIDEAPLQMFKSRSIPNAIGEMKELETIVMVIHARTSPSFRSLPHGVGVVFEDHGWTKDWTSRGATQCASFDPNTASTFFETGTSLKTVTAMYVNDDLVGETYEFIVSHCTSYERGLGGTPREMIAPHNIDPLRQIPPHFSPRLSPELNKLLSKGAPSALPRYGWK